jgi:hypothetical protein
MKTTTTATAGNPQHPFAPAPTAATPAIQWLGGGFGFNPATGEWFTANETALAVIGWQREGLAADAIAARLAEFFDVSCAAAQRDLETFFASGMGSMFNAS